MCGIAGYVGSAAGAARDGVAAMLRSLARRGPDAEGIESWPEAVFGHRRAQGNILACSINVTEV